MPMLWRQGENPYRTDYFAVLGLGPGAEPGVVSATCRKIVAKIEHGTPHEVGGRAMTITEVNQAEAGLANDQTRLFETLMAHPTPKAESRRLQQIQAAIETMATPRVSRQPLALTRCQALAPLLPMAGPEDVTWPDWEDFGVAGPDACEDRQLDVVFDL